MAASNEARIWGVIAASGTGKGVWFKPELKKLAPARAVIWDPKDEYGEFAPLLVRNTEALRQAMMRAGNGKLRIRYRCKAGTPAKQRRREFETVCMLVQVWGRCTFVVEELSQVTTPSWAPGAWQDMTTGGRHEDIHIVGIAQTPALIDKTFLGNCTFVHCGPIRNPRHRQAMAAAMDVPVSKIDALEQFHWIERDYNRHSLREGVTRPPGVAPTRTKPSATPTGVEHPLLPPEVAT